MDIIVIGGGPAGMMTAITAKNKDNNVTIFDSNEKLGKKLFITGKGRCNLTNDISPNDFLSKVISNSKFLYGGINTFTPQDAMEFVESNGTKLKVERGGRVFPVSDKSSDIIKAFERAIKSLGVKSLLECKVEHIIKVSDKFVVKTNLGEYKADCVVVATGGCSYSTTGSTGDGYKFAKDFGHNIVDIRPALVPIDLQKFDKRLAGLSLKNVKVTIDICGKKFTEFGEMLFTHTGVSGPIILSLSSKINRLNIKGENLSIDLKPALTEEQLDLRILRDFENYKNKDFKNYIQELLPKSMIEPFLDRLNFDACTKVNSITKSNRQEIIKLLKNFSFKIDSLKDVNCGIVTAGGVDVKQLNPRTMESKIVPGLYFVGEVVDLDAVTGGYNIQIALSTGYLAGKDIQKKEILCIK